MESYLSNRKIVTVVEGSTSDELLISCGVPQGSVLGPLLCLIYINDLPNGLDSTTLLYADDVSLHREGSDIQRDFMIMNEDLAKVEDWSNKWKLDFNIKKCVSMFFTRSNTVTTLPTLKIKYQLIENVTEHKHLGLLFIPNLDLSCHIQSTVSGCSPVADGMKYLSQFLSRQALKLIYNSYILTQINYASVIYCGSTQKVLGPLHTIQYNAALAASGTVGGSSNEKVCIELGWIPLTVKHTNTVEQLVKYSISEIHRLCLFFKILRGRTIIDLPSSFIQHTTYTKEHNLRSQNSNLLPSTKAGLQV
ncbi:unnamed protein product [Didymodactylos carnosus]|uniref:Reverse transcriptase domain-containing protein n=1 Tax=Didymodactylos carnosus TaxID=1234261 RepID=A0A815QGJ7_9BILA|nr:unnamed protein product [Didymodactylos carnosus]CAF4332179.1 unnamed protein product [Didymodactylos carnosus]